MFRVRTKPAEMRREKRTEQGSKSLSDAIKINQLCQDVKLPKDDSQTRRREILRRRHNFEDFRETYQQRLQKAQKKYQFINSIHCSPPDNGSFFNLAEPVNDIRKAETTRQVLRNIKTVKVEVPVASKPNAIWRLPAASSESVKNKTKRTTTLKPISEAGDLDPDSILKTLQKLEGSQGITEEQGSQVDLISELLQAHEQVDVASLQLKHINDLISKRRSNAVKNSTLESDVKVPGSLQATKWSVRNTSSRQSCVDKPKQLMDTLNTLNRRLQTMQDRMQKNRSAYKSIDDFLPKEDKKKRTRKVKGSPSIDSAVSELDFDRVLKTLTNDTGNDNIPLKLENPYRSSFRSALERIVEHEDEIIGVDSKTNVELSNFIPKQVFQDDSCVDVLLAPKHETDLVESNYNLVMDKTNLKHTSDKKEKKEVELEHSEEDIGITISSVFDQGLRESVLKSQYLSREFKGLPHDLLGDGAIREKQRKDEEGTLSAAKKAFKRVIKDTHKKFSMRPDALESVLNGTLYSDL